MTANSSAVLNASAITLSLCGVIPTPIVQADKYWLVRARGAGLRKGLNFSATRTKHKASLDMLNYVSKQLPYRRRNSTQQHLNEITKNKQGKVVQLILELKERKPIINSTTGNPYKNQETGVRNPQIKENKFFKFAKIILHSFCL